MQALIWLGCILLYLIIGAGVSWLFGKLDPSFPAAIAIIWPFSLPLIFIITVYEWVNRKAQR